MTYARRLLRRAVPVLLAAVLVALAPGLASYEAAAQVIGAASAGSASAGATAASAFGASASGIPTIPSAAALAPSLSGGLAAPSFRSAAASPAAAFAAPAASIVPALAAPAALPQSAVPTAAPAAALAAVPADASPAAAVAAPGAAIAGPAAAAPAFAAGLSGSNDATNVRAQLTSAADGIAAAEEGAKSGLLETLFTGARRVLAVVDGAPAFSPSSPASAAADASAKSDAASSPAAAPSPVRLVGAGLQPGDAFLAGATPNELEARAVDSAQPLPGRRAAVRALALGPDSRESLERVAAANPEGGAADYEVHREALYALAQQGVVKSLRPVSRLHADEILAQLASVKPAAAVFDYDDTLAGFREPVSPEIAAGLKASADAGVMTAVLTDRPDIKKSERDSSIVDSLSPMTPEQKSKLLVGADSGARVISFDAAGAPVLARDAKLRFTDAERAAIVAASAATAEKFGRFEYNGKEENLGDFKWVRFLPLGMPAETVQEAARFMQSRLDGAGVKITVAGRQAADPKNPSYLTISLLDKSVGIKTLREEFAARGVETAAAESMLIVGDSYFGTRTVDSDMSKAAPGALTIAVGGTADPRVENVFVWPTKGAAASAEILGALGRPAPKSWLSRALARVGHLIGWDAPSPKAPGPDDPINVKTLLGLVLQSVPSMAAYMLVTLAFVQVATSAPGVGWGGYGILMSLSPMAGIAAASIMGQAVKNMSARNAMALNTLLRVVSLSALPLFHLFGLVNFGTLLVGAMGEGFLLSSIMTTQGSFLRVLFPSKQLGNINNTLFMMFPFVQMILGALFSIGRVADVVSPFSIFTAAALINLALVPVVWKTIPNIKLAQGAAPAAKPAAPAEPFLARAAAFARANWKPALALAAGIGLFSSLTFLLPNIAALGVSLHLGWVSAFAAYVSAHHALTAPLPIIAALVYWISRTDAFRALISGSTREATEGEKTVTARHDALTAELSDLRRSGAADEAVNAKERELSGVEDEQRVYRKRQVWTVGLLALSTVMYYPLYLIAAPNVAGILAGPHKIELASQFLGALFLGGMISVSARTKLPDVPVPFVGGREFKIGSLRAAVPKAIGAHRLIQAAVVGTAGLWMITKVFPGAWLIAAAAAAVTAGLIALTARVTDRGWLKFAGVGFAAVWLPFVVWTWPALLPFLTVKTAMYLAMLAAGVVNGPSLNALFTYLYRNTKPSENSRVGGVSGSFFNAAISTGYALLAIASGFLNPAYPAVLAALGVINLLIGGVFWRAPRALPGLAPTILEPKKAPAAPAAAK